MQSPTVWGQHSLCSAACSPACKTPPARSPRVIPRLQTAARSEHPARTRRRPCSPPRATVQQREGVGSADLASSSRRCDWTRKAPPAAPHDRGHSVEPAPGSAAAPRRNRPRSTRPTHACKAPRAKCRLPVRPAAPRAAPRVTAPPPRAPARRSRQPPRARKDKPRPPRAFFPAFKRPRRRTGSAVSQWRGAPRSAAGPMRRAVARRKPRPGAGAWRWEGAPCAMSWRFSVRAAIDGAGAACGAGRRRLPAAFPSPLPPLPPGRGRPRHSAAGHPLALPR